MSLGTYHAGPWQGGVKNEGETVESKSTLAWTYKDLVSYRLPGPEHVVTVPLPHEQRAILCQNCRVLAIYYIINNRTVVNVWMYLLLTEVDTYYLWFD